MEGEVIKEAKPVIAGKGSAGLSTQLGGQATTVGGLGSIFGKG